MRRASCRRRPAGWCRRTIPVSWPGRCDLALAMEDGVRRRLAARARAFVVDEFGMERDVRAHPGRLSGVGRAGGGVSRRAGCALGLTAGASPPSRSCAVPHLPNGKAISSPRPGSGLMNLSASAPVDARASAPIAVTFPDGTTRSFPRGVTGAEIAAAIAKSLAKSALVVEVDGEIQDLEPADPARRARPADPRRGSRGAGGDPARLRACHGRGGAGPVPRHAGHHRPGDRERLLLRLLPQRAVLDRRSGPDRGADGRDRQGRPAVRARRR